MERKIQQLELEKAQAEQEKAQAEKEAQKAKEIAKLRAPQVSFQVVKLLSSLWILLKNIWKKVHFN